MLFPFYVLPQHHVYVSAVRRKPSTLNKAFTKELKCLWYANAVFILLFIRFSLLCCTELTLSPLSNIPVNVARPCMCVSCCKSKCPTLSRHLAVLWDSEPKHLQSKWNFFLFFVVAVNKLIISPCSLCVFSCVAWFVWSTGRLSVSAPVSIEI